MSAALPPLTWPGVASPRRGAIPRAVTRRGVAGSGTSGTALVASRPGFESRRRLHPAVVAHSSAATGVPTDEEADDTALLDRVLAGRDVVGTSRWHVPSATSSIHTPSPRFLSRLSALL